jgi:hypothetical protein
MRRLRYGRGWARLHCLARLRPFVSGSFRRIRLREITSRIKSAFASIPEVRRVVTFNSWAVGGGFFQ